MGLFSTTKKTDVTNVDNRIVDYSESDNDGNLAGARVRGDVTYTATDGEAWALASKAMDSVVTMSAEREQSTTDQLVALERSAETFATGGNTKIIPWVMGGLAVVAIAYKLSS